MASPGAASWETPDWDAPAAAGWWRIVYRPCVFALAKPIENCLLGGKGRGTDLEALGRLCLASGRAAEDVSQVHHGGEVLAMTESTWDRVHQTDWLRLRDEGAFGEQWIRADGSSLGLDAFLEPVATGAAPPPAEAREAHARVFEKLRLVRRRVREHMAAARTPGEAAGKGEAFQPTETFLGRRAAILGSPTGPHGCAAARSLLQLSRGDEDSAVVKRLLRDGYVVLFDVLPGSGPASLAAFVEEMKRLDTGSNLHLPPQQTPGQRGDRIVWLDEELASERYGCPAIGKAVALLKGIADALNPALSRHHAARAQAGDPARASPLAPPASPQAVLTVPPHAMAASYPGFGARYIPHTDARVRPNGDRVNSRELTAIIYANAPDWSIDNHGGALRIWPHSERLAEAPQAAKGGHGFNADGSHEILRRAVGSTQPVTIAPKGGRMVLFFSELWHEVLPARSARRALTLWILRPDEASARGCAAGGAEPGSEDAEATFAET